VESFIFYYEGHKISDNKKEDFFIVSDFKLIENAALSKTCLSKQIQLKASENKRSSLKL